MLSRNSSKFLEKCHAELVSASHMLSMRQVRGFVIRPRYAKSNACCTLSMQLVLWGAEQARHDVGFLGVLSVRSEGTVLENGRTGIVTILFKIPSAREYFFLCNFVYGRFLIFCRKGIGFFIGT